MALFLLLAPLLCLGDLPGRLLPGLLQRGHVRTEGFHLRLELPQVRVCLVQTPEILFRAHQVYRLAGLGQHLQDGVQFPLNGRQALCDLVQVPLGLGHGAERGRMRGAVQTPCRTKTDTTSSPRLTEKSALP